MKQEKTFKRTGYCGQFLTSRESSPDSLDTLMLASKSKLMEVFEALVQNKIFEKDDLNWIASGVGFSLPTNELSKYKFGFTDSQIDSLIEGCNNNSIGLTSGVVFDKDGILIVSSLDVSSMFGKQDIRLLFDLLNGFNFGNRLCVARLNVGEEIKFDFSTSIHLDYGAGDIASLCSLHCSLITSFLQTILLNRKETLSSNLVHSSLRKALKLPDNSRLTLPLGFDQKLEDVIKLEALLKDKGYRAIVSHDKEAVVINCELETRKSKINVELFISLSSWPSCLSMYCRIFDVDDSNLDWFKLNLGIGASLVYERNQTIEFVGNNIGASTFLYVPESSIENGYVIRNIELLLGFVEYHLDYLESSEA